MQLDDIPWQQGLNSVTCLKAYCTQVYFAAECFDILWLVWLSFKHLTSSWDQWQLRVEQMQNLKYRQIQKIRDLNSDIAFCDTWLVPHSQTHYISDCCIRIILFTFCLVSSWSDRIFNLNVFHKAPFPAPASVLTSLHHNVNQLVAGPSCPTDLLRKCLAPPHPHLQHLYLCRKVWGLCSWTSRFNTTAWQVAELTTWFLC